MLDAEIVKLKIDDIKIEVDFLVELLSKNIHERIVIAHAYHARAIKQRNRLKHEYRNERAKFFEAVLKSDLKLSEWKIRIRWESSDEFCAYKNAADQTDYSVRVFDALLDALHSKINISYHTNYHPILP